MAAVIIFCKILFTKKTSKKKWQSKKIPDVCSLKLKSTM